MDRTPELNMAYARIVARAWSDAAFKERLKADPKSVFMDEGFEVPTDVNIVIVEDDSNTFHFVLPPKPVGQLTIEELKNAASARTCNSRTSGAIQPPSAAARY